jgi:hypothetical protein
MCAAMTGLFRRATHFGTVATHGGTFLKVPVSDETIHK